MCVYLRVERPIQERHVNKEIPGTWDVEIRRCELDGRFERARPTSKCEHPLD